VSDELPDPLRFEEAPVPPWYPSPELRGQLLLGVWATLAAGALSLAGSLVDPALNLFQGFSLAGALGWACLVPLLLVLSAYQGLAKEAHSPGLGKSSLCLFGTIALFDVFELATLNGLPLGWQITCWVIFGLGLFFLLVIPFVSEDDEPTPAGEEPKAKPAKSTDQKESPSTKASQVGIAGGLGVGLLVVLKLFAKGLFVKILVFGRLFNNLKLQEIEAIAGGALMILGVIFFIWFAIAKIRLRGPLGGIAVLVGWVELLLLLLLTVLFAWVLATVFAAANRPGITEKDLDALFHQKSRELLPLELVSGVVWTALTMFLFLAIRSRIDLEQEWKNDLAAMPTDSA
jgi:hypothetical protein